MANGKVIIQVNSNAKKATRDFVVLDSAVRRTGNSAKATSKSFSLLSASTLILGSAMIGLVGAIKKTVTNFATFEETLVDVLNLLTKDEIKQFGKVLENISRGAIRAGFAIEDANKALFDTVSALGAGEQAFTAYTESQKLAKGGATDLSSSVKGVTSIMNAYGREVTKAGDVANTFFSAQVKGRVTVKELTDVIGKVAPIAKQAGVGYKELIATTAQLTLGGLSAEESATALRQTIASLIKPSKDAEKVLKQLGVPFGATQIKAEGLSKALLKLSEANRTNSDLLAKAIPNIRAFTGVSSLQAKQIKNVQSIVDKINDDIEKGTGLNEAYIRKTKTLADTFKRFGGILTDVSISLGDNLSPALISIIDLFGQLVIAVNKAFGLIGDGFKVVVENTSRFFRTFSTLLGIFNKDTKDAVEGMSNVIKKTAEENGNSIKKTTQNSKEFTSFIKSSSKGVGEALTQPWEKGTTAAQKFGSIALSALQKVAGASIAGGFTDLFGIASGGGGSAVAQAKGGAWSQGTQFFANGGVVNSPTAFGTSTGVGVMGEAGAEAILPLKRGGDGKLGVESAPPVININNMTDARIETIQKPDNQTEIFIRRVNSVLSSPRSDGAFGTAQQRASDIGVQAA